MRIEMMIAIIVLLIVSAVYVPASNAQTSEQRATKVRIDMRDIYERCLSRLREPRKR